MIIANKSRKSDKDLYNNYSQDFIPIACHYDENTLMTKNGELIQIIQINGINADNLSDSLFNLRTMVREAIEQSVNSDEYSFWIHTIRRKTNLDDDTPYTKLLSASIHSVWGKKNYWKDKFVNTLYLSVIHKAPNLSLITNLNEFFHSFSTKAMVEFHEKYFADTSSKLQNTVDKLLSALKGYGARKLGVEFENQSSYSEPIFLYKRISHLSEIDTLVPMADLSYSLATHQYAVGADKIEVISANGKKFAGIISIKEYQEISADLIDKVLQIPVELIATEIFYFMKNSEAKPYFSYQDYILKVSGDNILRKATGFEQAMNDTTDSLNKFCHQQISLMIIGENLSKLDEQMRHVSEELSKIGIVHVREDINLEQTFWAQLPGNFSFLRRMTPNLFSNVAALASLHNFPTGSKISPWGKPITLLRTERGTPYFMNFHDKAGNGNFCIFGCPRVGKTVLSNFLISESTKFNPNVLYFTVKNSSKIFIESLEGLWLSEQKNLLNPFLLDDNQENRDFCKEFLKIICTHYIEALPEESLLFLDLFIDHIFKLDQSTRTLSTAIESMNFETSGGEKIKSRLTAFSKDGNYSGVFDSTIKFTLPKSQLLAVELNAFSHQYFEDRFYPSDKKQLGNYENQSKINDSVRVSIVYAFIYHFLQASKSKNIVALDDLHLIIDPKYYNHILSWISEQCLINNGITLSNIDLSILQDEKTNLAWKDWKGLVNTQIIMPSDLIIEHLDKILGISKIEENKLNNMPTSSRMFIVKQDGNSLVAELSIGGLPSILKILSGGKEELEIYNKIKENDPSHPENWLQALYNAFDGQ